MPGTPSIVPFLRYADAAKAIAWLGEAFAFETIASYPDDSGGIAHAELRFGDALVMVSTHHDGDTLGMKLPKDGGGPTMGIYLVIDDVDAHHARAAAAGAKVVHPPTDEDYGGRDYSCLDPEGNIWSFGTYRPGEA